ncbi:MAG: hypothetical protein ACYCYN_12440 [Solirubrobacteraceae bacterium]
MPEHLQTPPPEGWGEPVATWKVDTKPRGPYIDWRPGYVLPRAWLTQLESPREPYAVELDMQLAPEGPVCLAIRFLCKEGDDAAPITAARLRALRVGEYIEVAITSAAEAGGRRGGLMRVDFGGDPDLSERARYAAQAGSDEHLRTVARIYSEASSKPTAAVEAAFPFHSRSTVGRWLKACRERGFLPKTTRGRTAANPAPEKEA